MTACRQPSGYVLDNTDRGPPGMVDQDSTIYLGAPEVCDLKDNNCNGVVDEGASLQTYYLDSDCDGYGATTATGMGPRCGPPATTPCYAPNNRDCNDANSSVNPGAPEVCNRIDDNCNGMIDEGLPQNSYYADCDQDGYGNNSIAAVLGCTTPSTAPPSCTSCPSIGACWVTRAGDCDDHVGTTHLNATEQCNGVDDDCNGLLDYAVAGVYEDQDRDGYASLTCHGNDCDDTRAIVHPGATEIAGDLLDENCDGHELCWPDHDNDRWPTLGAVSTALRSSNTQCNDSGQAPSPTPYTTDCGDTDPRAHPTQGAFTPVQTACGGYDFDCDGIITQQFPIATTLICAGSVCGVGAPGWLGSVPPCGVASTYEVGCLSNIVCIPQYVGQPQGCR